MLLQRLKLSNFRNIRVAEISPAQRVNLICGPNAAGKTSLLEAIYYLGHLRSFRSSSLEDIIHREHDSIELIASLYDTEGQSFPLGIRRGREILQVRINRQSVSRIAEVAKTFPVIAIHPESYRLITGSPAQRRQYMDWGVFHVEHAFFECWQNYRRALSQRNAALKSGQGVKICSAWDHALQEAADRIDQQRREYLTSLRNEIERMSVDFFPGKTVTMDYRRGWKAGVSLSELLLIQFEADRKRGFTQVGPHRAEIVFKLDGQSVQHGISRGQQKLMVALLRLAQARQFTKAAGERCVLLYDDLAAELDANHRQAVLEVLSTLEAQIFISSIEPEQINLRTIDQSQVFHVEHGCIRRA